MQSRSVDQRCSRNLITKSHEKVKEINKPGFPVCWQSPKRGVGSLLCKREEEELEICLRVEIGKD